MKRLIFSTLLVLVYLACMSQKIKVGLLVNDKNTDKAPETEAAYQFLSKSESFEPIRVDLSDLSSGIELKNFDVIWYHKADTIPVAFDKTTLEAINKYLQSGGNILLTLDAFRFVNDLGLEPIVPETRYKESKDEGYGRKLGLHAYRNHPLFDGLNGGAYIFRPVHDTTIRITGYFDQNIPLNGAVVAVDWDYIFLRENTKLVTEYNVNPGKGKVLAIGAYTCLSVPNYNQDHLEKFLLNALNYLTEGPNDQPAFYWQLLSPTGISI